MTTQDHLRIELHEAYLSLKVQKNLLLRAQEECKRAQASRDAIITQLTSATRERDVAKAKLDATQKGIEEWRKWNISLNNDKNLLEGQLLGCREANKVLQEKIDTLKKELDDENIAYTRLKFRLHGANYGIGPEAFKAAVLGQTATEVLEMQNLKREIERLRKTYEVLRNAATSSHTELKAECDAHNKLKALCNERGFGTPLFYTPPTLPKPEPPWTVSFYQKDIHLGDITYTRAPSAKTLNDLQESLRATSWKLIYRG